MGDGQHLPALMGALLAEGVSMDQIERAVASVVELPLGYDYMQLTGRPRSQWPMLRSFVHGQTRLLGQS